MKSRVPFNCAVVLALMIAAALLSSNVSGQISTTSGQDRCKNNENHIADYERRREAAAIAAVVFRQEDRARDLYSQMNSAIANEKVLPWLYDAGVRERILGPYGLDFGSAYVAYVGSHMDLQREVRSKLQAALDKIRTHRDLNEITAEIKYIDQQIDFHRNQLKVLGCGEVQTNRQVASEEDEIAYQADAGANDLTGNYPTRGFVDSDKVDFWIPFNISFPPPSEIETATVWIYLKPIGQLIGTDALGVKGADGKTYWSPIPFKNLQPEFQYVQIPVTEPAVIEAIKRGRLTGVVQDDSAVTAVKLVLKVRKSKNTPQPLYDSGAKPGSISTDSTPAGHTVSGGDLNSRVIHRVEPIYPEAARAAKVVGTVSVQVVVDEKGNVVSASAIGGHPYFQAAAESAVRQWRFTPAQASGRAVRMTGVVTVDVKPTQ